MKIDPGVLIGDPLYQFNLLLWMLQPSTGVTVKPLLHQAGYRLRSIEPRLTLPVALANKLQAEGMPAVETLEPELIVRANQGDYVLFECKRTMFGAQAVKGDGQIRQCRAYLLHVPSVLADALGGIALQDVTSTHILYVSRHDDEAEQFKGVETIAAELLAKGCQTALHGLLTLDISAGQIGLRKTATHGTLPAALATVLPDNFTPLHPIPDAETDPRPLYYMPWMVDSEWGADDYNQNAFANRILGCAAAKIGPARTPCDVELDIEALLNGATNDFYKFWRNRDSQKHVRQHALQLLKQEIAKADTKAVFTKPQPPNTAWKLTLPDAKMQSRIVEQFRKWQSEVWITPPTLKTQELFPE